jgi:hypothetical protein
MYAWVPLGGLFWVAVLLVLVYRVPLGEMIKIMAAIGVPYALIIILLTRSRPRHKTL